MSESIFETFTDERGNISVRISQEVQVLTREEANRIEAEYRRMQAENAKLREQIHWLKHGDILHVLTDQEYIDQCERERLMQVSIDALDKENAKLRESVNRLMTQRDERLARAEADNAKLRKLLTFYLGCLTKGHVNCDSCDFAEDVCEHGRKVIDWARELGIEVDA